MQWWNHKEYLLLGSIWVASIIITWTIIFSWKELPDKNSNPITPNTEVSKENSTLPETITSTWDIDEDALRKEKKDTLVATDNKNAPEIIDNPTIEDLKRELAQWHPIIAPFAGKKLWNSFFTNGGPRYHMLVIVWYNDSFFITNDVGTSRWKDFAYSYNVIMDSLHDLVPEWEWNIADWAKRVLVIK